MGFTCGIVGLPNVGKSTLFTVNPRELHAWTVRAGTTAAEAAGKIHSDFEKGFIRAEVMSFADLERWGSEQALKEHGLLRVEGRDHPIADGDIVTIRFSV
jgi:ribosome-binding ATPase YchF (GTP1/OBG family)